MKAITITINENYKDKKSLNIIARKILSNFRGNLPINLVFSQKSGNMELTFQYFEEDFIELGENKLQFSRHLQIITLLFEYQITDFLEVFTLVIAQLDTESEFIEFYSRLLEVLV